MLFINCLNSDIHPTFSSFLYFLQWKPLEFVYGACTCVLFLFVQSLSNVRLFAIPLTTIHQAPLSFTIAQSLLKLMSVESVMLSNHLIFCHILIFLPSIFPNLRSFPMSRLTVCIWALFLGKENKITNLGYSQDFGALIEIKSHRLHKILRKKKEREMKSFKNLKQVGQETCVYQEQAYFMQERHLK